MHRLPLRHVVVPSLAFAFLAGCGDPIPSRNDDRPTPIGRGDEGEGEGRDVVAEGEGEGIAVRGEGEGEGIAVRGEGEGEGNVVVAEGEGEGNVVVAEGEGEGSVVVDPDPDPTATAVDVLKVATRAGTVVDGTLQLLWEVISVVSNARQAVTLTGTLDARGTGTPQVTTTPTDALVYLDDNNVNVRFVVTTFTGDFAQNNAQDFLFRDHDVVVGVTFANADTFSCNSHLRFGAGTRGGSGRFADGRTFSYTSTRNASATVSTGSVDYTSTEVRTGTITGTQLNLSFTDTTSYHGVLVQDLAEDVNTILVVNGTAKGASWSLPDGSLKRTFRNTAAVEPTFWQNTRGSLKRNGTPFGAVQAVVEPGKIRIVLHTPTRDVDLESFNR